MSYLRKTFLLRTGRKKQEERNKHFHFLEMWYNLYSIPSPFVLCWHTSRFFFRHFPIFALLHISSLLLSNFLVFCTLKPSYHNFYNSLVCLLFLVHNLPSRIFRSMPLVWERESDIVKFVTFITQTHSTRMDSPWFQGKLGTQALIVWLVLVCPLSTRIVLLKYGKVYWAEKIRKIWKEKWKRMRKPRLRLREPKVALDQWTLWLRSFFLVSPPTLQSWRFPTSFLSLFFLPSFTKVTRKIG